jgi:hypothetical protein
MLAAFGESYEPLLANIGSIDVTIRADEYDCTFPKRPEPDSSQDGQFQQALSEKHGRCAGICQDHGEFQRSIRLRSNIQDASADLSRFGGGQSGIALYRSGLAAGWGLMLRRLLAACAK